MLCSSLLLEPAIMTSAREGWTRADLRGRVAVVTGASRGIGRGIAEVLGACGAKVYAVARDTKNDLASVTDFVDAAGGQGVPVRSDLRSDNEAEALFHRVAADDGRLDILVNNAIGWDDRPSGSGSSADEAGPSLTEALPLWRQPLWWWDGNFASGVRMHVACCRFGIPLMLRSGSHGLVLFTSERAKADAKRVWDIVLDARAHATARLVSVLAAQLRPRGIAAAVLYPGWTRTESMIAATLAGAYPLARSLEELNAKTVSPHFAGRAVALLATDPQLLERSGGLLSARRLATELGFTDVDGRIPEGD
jgi:NAD(P)-dependent dehydrogenase (short-subunit alcohol dehydrogenase family)